MNLLLDSHVLLWWLQDAARLRAHRDLIVTSPRAVVSAATFWELGIKEALGKLRLGRRLTEVVPPDFETLPITAEHAEAAAALPRLHADPFDRMLVAQASLERVTLITSDGNLADYGGDILLI